MPSAIVDVVMKGDDGKPVNIQLAVLGNQGTVIRKITRDGTEETDFPDVNGIELLNQIRKNLSDKVFDTKEAGEIAAQAVAGIPGLPKLNR